ncbi:hypothetical protein BO70DRAFT_395776 [Aspergillus heteromorphus CBS 117.55]|uniref:Catalase core domain-containing protein n=1 Tax=Aspergillus heteromorphus CBS 117.55 TaxID=1448321 RepID=A0A317WE78_9EURO|nr:uncharacterized protein BO70DRAFT_395776 [Aspergillus heteromorphus CBS 117.55]PWY83328.1 hypothetical protein BO70DRAFT_395776 [Aspergillus heteromorphus CBS 117.55]
MDRSLDPFPGPPTGDSDRRHIPGAPCQTPTDSYIGTGKYTSGWISYSSRGLESLCPLQPVFFVRDPIKFPSLNRSHKRHQREKK